MNTLKIHIMMGLPGSGKTFFSESLKSDFENANVIHCDDYLNYYLNTKHDPLYMNEVRHAIDYRWYKEAESKNKEKIVIIDGLILTNQNIVDVVSAILDSVYGADNVYLTVHRWNDSDQDRAICLKNDQGRRDKASDITIRNATVEQIDENYIFDHLSANKLTAIVQKNYNVAIKPDWIRTANNYVVLSHDGKLRSPRWTTGGNYGNINGERFSVDPEEPEEFDALDNMLEKICPKLTFIEYKKIQKACVSVEETEETDYYNSISYYQNWVCDVKALFKMLNDFGYCNN